MFMNRPLLSSFGLCEKTSIFPVKSLKEVVRYSRICGRQCTSSGSYYSLEVYVLQLVHSSRLTQIGMRKDKGRNNVPTRVLRVALAILPQIKASKSCVRVLTADAFQM